MTMESHNPIIIYDDTDKAVEVRLDMDQETVWLTQRQLADVFDTSIDILYSEKGDFLETGLTVVPVVLK